jgi:hypothetical protein
VFRTRHQTPTELVARITDALTEAAALTTCPRCGAPGDDYALAQLAERTATDIATRYGPTGH